MNNKSLVTVIIPTYNRASTLGRAVESVLKQTYENIELLVCDDCSSDNSAAIVSSYKDTRVKWIVGKRGGRPSIPRNRGMSIAKGEYIAFLDSDDFWLPNHLEVLLGYMSREKCKLISANAHINSINGPLYFTGTQNHRYGFWQLIRDNKLITSATILHRSFLSKGLKFVESNMCRLGEDFVLGLHCTFFDQAVVVSDATIVYSKNSENKISDERVIPGWELKLIIITGLALSIIQSLKSTRQ